MPCLQPTVCTGPENDGPTCEVCALTGRVARLEALFMRELGGDYLSLQALYIQRLADIKALELRVKDLERSERELAEQRDHAEEWADKLAEAIALHCREDIGEHSNLNNPWSHAHNLIAGNFCR